jgi:DNA-binding MarR family transcriptional regulator
MPITPETRDRLASSVSQLLRTGRHVSSRAATQLYGELPSFGWALLVPLERDGDQRCSVLALQAGVDVSVASRQIAVLERLGYVERRPDPQDGRASLLRLTEAGAAALAAARALRSEWALTALAAWDESEARLLAGLLDRLVTDLETAGSTHPATARSTVPAPR